MLTKSLKPFIQLAVLVVLVGLACGAGSSETPPTNPPAPTAVVLPTNPPAPTLPPTATNPPPTLPPPPAATDVPTEPPAATEPPVSNQPPAFYIEEFEGDLSLYTCFIFPDNDCPAEMVFGTGEELGFSIGSDDTWMYVFYNPYTYGDVRIGMSATNRGVNSQRVSLICRVSEDGWFEFNIGGDGLYEIWVYDAFRDDFALVGNGGSTAIRLGRDTNEYIAECIGDTLTLYINGTFVNSFTVHRDYRFMDEGYVGFAVSSFNVTPVEMFIDWFGIEEP